MTTEWVFLLAEHPALMKIPRNAMAAVVNLAIDLALFLDIRKGEAAGAPPFRPDLVPPPGFELFPVSIIGRDNSLEVSE